MFLSTRSWHYRLYVSAYNQAPGRDFCGYFWKLALAILLTPISWPSHLLNFFRKLQGFYDTDDYFHQFFGACVSCLSIFVGAAILSFSSAAVEFIMVSSIGGLFLLQLVGFIGLLVGLLVIVAVVTYAADAIEKGSKKVSKKPSLIATKLKSVKEKNCPLISWREHV